MWLRVLLSFLFSISLFTAALVPLAPADDANHQRLVEQPGVSRRDQLALAADSVSQRKYRRGLQLYQDILARDRRNGNRRGEATVLQAIGTIYEELGQTRKALETFQAAMAMHRGVGDTAGEATCLHHLGLLHQYSGEYEKARELYRRSRLLCQQVGDVIGEAFCVGGLAFIGTTQGNYAHALAMHQQALRLFQQADDKRGQGITLNDIGLSYSAMGCYQRAAEYHLRALAIADDLNDPVGKTMVLTAMADLYQQTDNWVQSVSVAERGLQLARAIGHRSAEATFLANLGHAAAARGAYTEALDFNQTALAIHLEVGNQFAEAGQLAGMAAIHVKLNHLDQARSDLERATALSRKNGNLDVLAWCLAQHGTLNAASDNLRLRQRAGVQLAEAIELVEQMSLGLSTQSKSALHGDYALAYETMIGLLVDSGQAAQAWVYAERARSQALLQMLGNRRITVRDAPTEVKRRLSDLDGKIRALSAAPPSPQIAHHLIRLKESYANALEEIWVRCPEAAMMQQVRVPRIETVQSALGSDRLLVEYYFGSRQSWVWTVSGTRVSVYPISATRETLASQVARARGALCKRGREPDSAGLEELSQLVLTPFAEQLKMGPIRLLVAPHSTLHYVPFSALTLEGRTLLETHTIETTSSAATWVLGEKSAVVDNDRVAIAALGNFDALAENRQTTDAASASNVHLEMLVGRAVEPLPGTLEEARIIAKLFPDHELIREKQMTREAIQQAASRAGIVHIATHASLDANSPLFSGLVTANGLITVADLLDWQLDANLVVLSACSTAVGGLGGGDEMVGLTRSLRYAGCDHVLASLWPVSDAVTAEWMEIFYRRLKAGDEFADAARTAALKIRLNYPEPFYWAPFVLMN